MSGPRLSDTLRQFAVVFTAITQVYFSYTIGCTSQTSDVGVSTRHARGIVLVHSILTFIFNTSILAMAINVGAGLVSGGS